MSENIGLKLGSLNTAVAQRNGKGIETKVIKTCVRYEKALLKDTISKIIVGDEAADFKDAKFPLHLGLVENEVGIQQLKDILKTLIMIPQEGDIVIASPATEINEGTRGLNEAVQSTFNPKNTYLVSEALCSAIYLLLKEGHIQEPNELRSKTLLSANLGSSTFEFGCFDQADVVYLSAHSEAGGNIVDTKALNKIQNAIGDAMVSLKDVRTMKEQASLTEPREFTVKGQSRDGIVMKTVSDEVTGPIRNYVNTIADIIKAELRNIDPQVRKSAFDMPLSISGGMANIDGLPEMLTQTLNEKLNYSIKTVYSHEKNAHMTAAIGALRLCEAVEK